MSMLVIGKFKGDTAKFRHALTERAGEFAKISDMARSAGGIHHRFGVGDGFVMMIDEMGDRRAVPAVLLQPRPAGLHRVGRCRSGTPGDHDR